MNDDHRPHPQCLLQMHDLIETTSERTATRVQALLKPLFDRIDRVEGRIVGNGTPGLSEKVRILQVQHEDMLEKHEDMRKEHLDSIMLRRQIWLVVAGHALAIVAAIIWAAQWISKVEHYMAGHP